MTYRQMKENLNNGRKLHNNYYFGARCPKADYITLQYTFFIKTTISKLMSNWSREEYNRI